MRSHDVRLLISANPSTGAHLANLYPQLDGVGLRPYPS